MKYSFCNDYSEIAHPRILECLNKYANEQNVGYGFDNHSLNAEKLIKKTFNIPNSSVYFLVGGTQTNLVMISHVLRDYQAVLACSSGHINVHETGAVEATGHKVITMPGKNGKLSSEDIKNALKINNGCHMVEIKMVYISNSTEIGSVYTKEELTSIYHTCKENNLYLFIDGARLSSALESRDNDLTKEEFASLCDAFYVGGTKIGFMIGEALVINNHSLKEGMKYHIKTRGAMLAKGFINGMQYEAMFEDNLYFDLGKKENELAYYLEANLLSLGFKFYSKASTNQLFVIIDKSLHEKLKELYLYEIWDEVDDKLVVRFVISWFTTKEVVEELIKDIKNLLNK